MAARLTGDTSDDSHLADDSKRQENAAGHSGYAPPVQEERRIASDGNSYTLCEFIHHYGEGYGNSKWTAAQHTPPPAPPPQEIDEVEAAAVNTLLTPPPAPPPQEIPEVQVGEIRAAAVNTLLTPRTVEEIRRAFLQRCTASRLQAYCWQRHYKSAVDVFS